jgi:predicted RNA binding protein YcfA (HicA-like mRNA interferase family)
MKPMKLKDVKRLLEKENFVLDRNSGHIIYYKNGRHIALSRDSEVSPGVMRQIVKLIKELKG